LPKIIITAEDFITDIDKEIAEQDHKASLIKHAL